MSEKREGEPIESTSAEKKAKTDGYTLNVNNALDKEHESKSFKEVIKLPPGAIQGLKEGPADKLFEAFKIKTIKDLGQWKYFKIARAIVTLAAQEEDGKRAEDSLQNINKALDQEYEKKSLKEIVEAPVSALQGLAEWADKDLGTLGIKSVGDLGAFKYCAWAESLCVLAEHETADFGSK
eukprot:CAMPEP_0113682210 /NCGR_PEP_ID=MMETSP0038_2-20120614/12507_1 /TAXON_ID=2898 /ORGANISM="Cryptomonas paramecium" /LENGTH=179 /DNA_ID=CAMNT_0000601195 /DNA_START=11 /DNA_END=550 /DNA_ORIENTATION=- /assembly_acc=CAM_ASM_000170